MRIVVGCGIEVLKASIREAQSSFLMTTHRDWFFPFFSPSKPQVQRTRIATVKRRFFQPRPAEPRSVFPDTPRLCITSGRLWAVSQTLPEVQLLERLSTQAKPSYQRPEPLPVCVSPPWYQGRLLRMFPAQGSRWEPERELSLSHTATGCVRTRSRLRSSELTDRRTLPLHPAPVTHSVLSAAL